MVAAGQEGLREENERLHARVLGLEDTLRAIRAGEVDALVVETSGKNQVFTLKSADQTYRLIVEQMQKGAATLSQEGLVLFCNPFMAALLHAPLETVLGAPISAFLDKEGADILARLLKTAECGLSGGEISFRRGEDFVFTQVSLTPLPIEGVNVFCMIVTDLTERRRYEVDEVLRRVKASVERSQFENAQRARGVAEEANQILQGEIERRTLVEQSLRQAEKDRTELLARERLARSEADEANRLKDEFLATLSHELRTPLSTILTWAHVLRQPGLDPAIASRAVDAIDRNARAQTALVANLLDVSQIIAGKFHISLGPVSLSDVIESAARSVRPAATIKNIHLQITVDPTAGSVLGDASRLQQMVWNLLSNAIRLTPAGGCVEVQVKAAPSCIEMSVADDGAGIDPEFLPHMFDRFRQGDSSSTRHHRGLGLGLAMVRHLVELHGGSVDARNREDHAGAVFVVRLPRPHEVGAVPAPGKGDEPKEVIREDLAQVRVLLVDDDADTREAMAIGLTYYGAVVTIASSARQALDLLTRKQPDVMVADIGMPDEDGHALLQKVRALAGAGGESTPAIALTAYATAQDRLHVLRSGFQIHLAKPVTPFDLAAAINTLLRTRRGNGSSLRQLRANRELSPGADRWN
jgi:PAS domain S-box-containing protein